MKKVCNAGPYNSPIFVPGTLLGTLSINGEGLGVVVGKSAKDGILLKKSNFW